MLGKIQQKVVVGISPVSVNIGTNLFCLRWSEDDRVAVLTTEGIKILVLLVKYHYIGTLIIYIFVLAIMQFIVCRI